MSTVESAEADADAFSDLRLLSVKQPWAWALVNGYKSKENRSKHVSKKLRLPKRVAIVASASKPDRAMIADLRARMIASGYGHVPIPTTFSTKCIVGTVCITDSLEEAPADPWYIPPNKAWVVDRPISFAVPIANVVGSQTPNRYLSTHPEADRIRHALKNCEDPGLKP